MERNPKWSSLRAGGRPAWYLLRRGLHWVYTCCVFNTSSECEVVCVCVSVCAHPRLFVSMAAVDQASGTPEGGRLLAAEQSE